MTKLDYAWRYALRIRNPNKREYAIQYLSHLRGLRDDPEPQGIGTMAAQSVRMRLHSIWFPGD